MATCGLAIATGCHGDTAATGAAMDESAGSTDGEDHVPVGGESSTGAATPAPRGCDEKPSSGLVEELAPLPEPRMHHGAVQLHDGDLVVAGGTDCDGAWIEGVARYERATDAWHGLAPLPEPTVDAAMIRGRPGEALLLGGSTAEGASASAWRLDADANTWHAAAALPEPLARPVAVVLEDGRPFVMNGHHGERAFIGDPDGTAWIATAEVEATGDVTSLVALPSGRVLLASSGQSPGILVEYDPSIDAWSPPEAPTTHEGHGVYGWVGAAALATPHTVLLLHEQTADSEGSAIADLTTWRIDDEPEDLTLRGFCPLGPHTSSSVAEAFGVGRGRGRAMLSVYGATQIFDAALGWIEPDGFDLPRRAGQVLELDDRGFAAIGGDVGRLACEATARVLLWRPDGPAVDTLDTDQLND